MTRTEPCVCGGCISAPADDWQAIANAVNLHNRSPEHQAWRIGWNLARHPNTWGLDGLGVARMRPKEVQR